MDEPNRYVAPVTGLCDERTRNSAVCSTIKSTARDLGGAALVLGVVVLLAVGAILFLVVANAR